MKVKYAPCRYSLLQGMNEPDWRFEKFESSRYQNNLSSVKDR